MTITLLSQQEYDTLLQIKKDFPALSFQNVGYQYINRDRFSAEEKAADAQVMEILKKHIKGVVSFDNFTFRTNKITKEKVWRVRFQYNWTADEIDRRISFTGVGYILIDELLNGFEGTTKTLI